MCVPWQKSTGDVPERIYDVIILDTRGFAITVLDVLKWKNGAMGIPSFICD